MKYRIAFSGVFDIANYGDHLFPDIFECWMREHGIECEIDLFSPVEGRQALKTERHVYATQTLAQKYDENQYDAIVVSGGALIQLRSVSQRFNETSKDFRNYPIYESWVIPSLVSMEKGSVLLWNCPGVPYDFRSAELRLVGMLTEPVDFLAVRNEASEKVLRPCVSSQKEIAVAPDPAFLLSRYYKDEKLSLIRKRLGLSERYIVFHTHRLIPDKMLDQVVETLRKLCKSGENIVLLPLAYTHADEEIGGKIAALVGEDRITLLSERLNMEQMIAVLAGCQMYIGVSFHGAITAFSYGKKVLALDFFRYRKTEDVYKVMGESEYYLTDSEQLCEKAIKLLKEPRRAPHRLRVIQERIDSMYRGMSLCLRKPRKKKAQPAAYSYISLLHDVYSIQNDALNEQKQKTDGMSQMLRSYADSLQNYVNSLADYHKSLNGFVDYLDQSN